MIDDLLLPLWAFCVLILLCCAGRYAYKWKQQQRAQTVKTGKFKVLYEVRTEQGDMVLEKGAVLVKDVDRDFAFSTAAKQVMDDDKKFKYRDIYVACVAVQEVTA